MKDFIAVWFASYAYHSRKLHRFGGEYVIQTGANMGSTVYGQDPLWLAWVNDLINYKDAGNMSAYQHLINTITPARFKSRTNDWCKRSCFRHYTCNVQKSRFGQKRKKYRSMFFSAGLAVLLTGVTEPVEFMFMFCAIPLYIVYAISQGCAFALADIIHLRLHSFGDIELITRLPMAF